MLLIPFPILPINSGTEGRHFHRKRPKEEGQSLSVILPST